MSTTKLLETLLDIERRLGRAETSTLRNLVMDAQTQVLNIQKEAIKLLEEVQQLRERGEVQMPGGSWRTVVQALAQSEADGDALRAGGPVVVVNRAS